jgi:hypothetical protein
MSGSNGVKRMKTTMLIALAGGVVGLSGMAQAQATKAGGGAEGATPVRLNVPQNQSHATYLVSNVNAATSAASLVFDAAPGHEYAGFTLYNQVVVKSDDVGLVRKVVATRPTEVATNAPVQVSELDLSGWVVVETGTVGQAVEIAEFLRVTERFESVSVDWRQPMVNLALPFNDPLVGNQWHLENLLDEEADLNTAAVYTMGYNGAGVTVGVIEAGEDNFLVDHPDLAGNFSLAKSQRMTLFPVDQSHGTAVAGIIGAVANNGEGVAGIAPGSRLAAIRNGSSIQTMQAFNWMLPSIQIKNNSWGPQNAPAPFIMRFVQADYVMDALERAARFGRGNKGQILIFAAGNEGQYLNFFGARADYHELTSSRWGIVVGAVGEDNVAASYTNAGSSVFVSAYSGGDAGRAITTTTTPSMFNPSYYTNNFAGTSAAAPVVAGVVALMLDANGSLTLTDVKHILADTSRPLNFSSTGIYFFTPAGPHPFGSTYWQTNGGFKRHSDAYGFGLIDAEAAVNAALSWVNVKKPQLFDTGIIPVGEAAPDANFVEFPPESGEYYIDQALFGPNSLTQQFCVRPDALLQEIEVTLSVEGAWVGDVMITLTSPFDTISTLAVPRPDPNGGYTEYTFTTYKHWGELSSGNWTLTLTDYIPAEPFDDNDGEYTVDLAPFQYDGIDGAAEKTLVSYRVRMYGEQQTAGDFFLCPPLGQACPGDMNGDGIVTVDDLQIFLDLYWIGDPWADLNDDGLVTYADLQLFLGSFSPGYCDPGPGPGGQNGRPFPGGGDVGTPIGGGPPGA